MRDSHLAARLYSMPLMVHPRKAAIIEGVLRAHMRGESVAVPQVAGQPPHERPQIESRHSGIKWRARDGRAFAMTESGIAVIPVLGTLVHRGMEFDALSGIESYNSIDSRFGAALQAAEVRAILFEYDTWGGEVFGCAEQAKRIAAARGVKPVWAAINEECYSAGYFLASSSEKIYLPRTAETCNIGTIALHVDQSKFDAALGVEYTYIYDGDFKKDLNPHEPIGDGPRERLQVLVSRHGLIFREHVAALRGLTEAAVRATQAGVLTADDAVELGFADGIANFEETVALLEDHLGSDSIRNTGSRNAGRFLTPEKEKHMSKETPAGAQAEGAADELKHTDVQLNAAVEKARTEGHAAGKAEATAASAEGIKTERERVRGILGHAESKQRGALASALALNTDMSVEQAATALAAAPKEAAANPLGVVMDGLNNPVVGADLGGAASGDGDVDSTVNTIVALHRQASGKAVKATA